MPIQFSEMMPIPSPEEQNPFLSQLGKAMKLGIGFPLDVQKEQIANALKKVELQNAPEMSAADLALKKAHANLYQQMTAEKERGKPYEKLQLLLKSYNEMRTGGRFNAMYQLSNALRNMDDSSRNLWIAQHPEEYSEMLSTLARGDQQSDQLKFLSNQIFQEMKNLYPEMSNQQIVQQINQQSGLSQPGQQFGQPSQQPVQQPPSMGVPQIPGAPQIDLARLYQGNVPFKDQMDQVNKLASMPPKDFAAIPFEEMPTNDPVIKEAQDDVKQRAFSSTPDQVEQLKLSQLLFANRKQSDPQTNRRANSAVALDSWLLKNHPEYSQRMLNAINYAGLTGKVQKYLDAGKKVKPQGYLDYLWFTTEFKTFLSNKIRMQDALGADQEQRKELNSLMDAVDMIGMNPEAAASRINDTIRTIGQVSDAIYDSAEPITKGLYKKVYNLKDFPKNYIDKSKIRIKVRDKKTNKIGSILKSDYNPEKYEKVKLS